MVDNLRIILLDLCLLARVEGNMVATRKHPSLEGWRLVICQPIGASGEPEGAPQVAIDCARRGHAPAGDHFVGWPGRAAGRGRRQKPGRAGWSSASWMNTEPGRRNRIHETWHRHWPRHFEPQRGRAAKAGACWSSARSPASNLPPASTRPPGMGKDPSLVVYDDLGGGRAARPSVTRKAARPRSRLTSRRRLTPSTPRWWTKFFTVRCTMKLNL